MRWSSLCFLAFGLGCTRASAPPSAVDVEPNVVPEPSEPAPEDETSEEHEPHRVADLDRWDRDCKAIDEARARQGMEPARVSCTMRGDFDGDGKTDRIDIRRDPESGSSGLGIRWGNGTYSMLGGGRRVLFVGAPDPSDPEFPNPDEVYESMDWVADAKVVPLRPDGLRLQVAKRPVTFPRFEGITGDALYLSGDDAAAIFYFEAEKDRWRWAHLGF